MNFDPTIEYGAHLYDDGAINIIGCPNAQADFWEMQTDLDNCEPTAESFIIRQFGFDNITNDDFSYISQANGWYSPGSGTSPYHMGEMMDLFGIGNHTIENASILDLAAEIAQGHGVIVGVRSDQLWEQGPFQDLWNWAAKQFGFDNPTEAPADHALCVTGFDTSDPGHPMVIVNDPGHPAGQGQAYPLDRFMDAWENSHCVMTATNDPLPTVLTAEIHHHVESWLAENGIVPPENFANGPFEVAGSLGKSADEGFNLHDFAESVHDVATPIMEILTSLTGIIAGVAGAVVATNTLHHALNDSTAYDL